MTEQASQSPSSRTWRRPIQAVIGELRISGDTIKTKRHTIEAWEGYGVTCYPLGSLNGSIRGIASNLVATIEEQSEMRRELNDPGYTVRAMLEGEDVSGENVEQVVRRLTALLEKHTLR